MQAKSMRKREVLFSSVKFKKAQRFDIVRRLAVSHLQVLGLVGQMKLHFPDAIVNLFAASDTVSSFSFFSGNFGGALECSLRPAWLPKPAFLTLSSLCLFALSYVVNMVYWYGLHGCVRNAMRCCKKKSNKEQSSKEQKKRRRAKLIVSLIALWYMMYASLARAGLSLFSCQLFEGETDSRLRDAYNVKCWKGEHLLWTGFLGVPFILLIVIGIPLGGWFALYQKRDKLAATSVMEKYAFLYVGYQDKYWYWELIIVTRKVVLAALAFSLLLIGREGGRKGFSSFFPRSASSVSSE